MTLSSQLLAILISQSVDLVPGSKNLPEQLPEARVEKYYRSYCYLQGALTGI